MHASRALVFLAELFNQSAGDEILEFFVSSQTEHFLAAAHCISQFKICKDPLKQIIETEDFFLCENTAKFIGDMIG